MALPWLSGSGVGRVVPSRRGGRVLAGVIYGVEWGCFPSADAVLGNVDAAAQPALAVNQGTSAAHRVPAAVSHPRAPPVCVWGL